MLEGVEWDKDLTLIEFERQRQELISLGPRKLFGNESTLAFYISILGMLQFLGYDHSREHDEALKKYSELYLSKSL